MNIIPKVKSIKEKGEIFISPEFSSDERLSFCKKTFLRMCRKIYGVRLKSGDAGIKLLYDESLNKDEYKINGAFVYASDTEGAAYGLATMIQLMEKAENVLAGSASFYWNDLGCWSALRSVLPLDTAGNAVRGNAAVLDAADNVLISDPQHMIGVIGMQHIAVIQSGNGVLVCPLSAEQRVKELIQKLDKEWK